MFKRHTALLLSLIMWFICAATSVAQSVQNELIQRILQNGGLVTLTSQRTTTLSITETEDLALYARTTDPNDQSQWWLIQPLGNGKYALRNYATGNYVQAVNRNDAPYPTGETNTTTFYIKQSDNATNGEALVTISTSSGFSGISCLHDAASHAVVRWYAGSNGQNTATDWTLKAVEGIDAATLKTHFAAFSHQVMPGNKVVKIRNVETGKQISENSEHKLIAADASDEDFSQFWVMEESSTAGQYTLRNVMTNRYFNYVAYSSGYRYFNDQITNTSKSTSSNYVFTPYNDAWELSFSISSPTKTTEYYTHANVDNSPSGRPSCYIYNIDAQSSRTRWFLVETELDADDVAKAQEDFNTYKDIDSKKSTYTSVMNKYFTDASYSELNDTYKSLSADQLSADMRADNLPQYLIDIALKVKNDTWNTEDAMSKDFRVADYKVYSDNMKSPRLMGVGYGFGRLSNPTGIVVKPGDIVSVFCDKNAPANTTLQLEVVKDTDAAGSTFPLNKGVNIFSFSGAATLYIFYQTVGGNDFSIATAPKLADCPDIKIHIEGGRLQGYYDKTRNHNNETWAHLRTNLLKESNVMNVKTDNFVLCFNNQRVKDACPTDMVRTVEAWDNMANWENDLMGYNDEHIPGLSTVHRNIYNFFSKEKYMGGSMMTALYGVQTLSGNISGHMSYAQMESDGVWGPAHENGHLRQNLIYTLGSLESSCNLFSEAVTYELGHSASRTAYSSAIFDKFAKNTTWLGFQGSEVTRMFQQLYLYFHVNNVMPDFYPRLFDELRADPMVHNTSTHEVKGGEEYLKLAVKMCKVANADLSDFFEVYGFFRPQNRQQVYENGIFWYLTTTQAEIDAALTEMHKYPKKYGNIIFIEDRIEAVRATYKDAPANAIKNRSNDPAHAGNVGQYTTFLEKTPNIDGYYYSVADDGVVTIHGTGAKGLVGFKVYDESGNLVCLSNFLNFTLPEAVRSQNYTVKAALSTGIDVALSTTPTDIVIPDPDPEPENQTVTYDFFINGTKVFSENHQVTVGDAEYPNITVAIPYGVSCTKPAGPVTNAATKNINLTWNLPFEYTPSIDAANVAWYNLRVNTPGTNNCYYYDSTQSPNVKAHAATPGEDPKYLWAFVGDPFNGFVIYNKAAGTDKALNNDNKCNISAAGLSVKFKFEAGNGNRTGEFSIVDPAIQNDNKYLNGNNELGRHSKDNGSSFAVTKVELTPDPEEPDTPEALAEAEAAYEEASEAIMTFFEDNYDNETPGVDEILEALSDVLDEIVTDIEDKENGSTVTVADYTAATAAIYAAIEEARAAIEDLSNPGPSREQVLQDKIDALMEAIYEGTVGYPDAEADANGEAIYNMSEFVSSFETTITESDYDAALAAYNAVLALTDVNLPQEGKAYTIKAKFQDGSYKYIVNLSNNLLGHSDTPDSKWVVKQTDDNTFVLVEAETGKYFYIEADGKTNASMDKTVYNATKAVLTITKHAPSTGVGYANATSEDLLGCLTIKGENTKNTETFPLLAGTDGTFRNGGANDYYYDYNINGSNYRSCEFIFEEVEFPYTTKSLNNGGDGHNYATVALPYAMEIPAGVKAYAAAATGDVLYLSQVVSPAPAGAYILVSESESTTDIIPAAAAPTTVSNELRGSITTAPEGDIYVLNKDAEGVGFFKFNGNYNTLLGKAYLPASAKANKLSFRFDDVITAISAIESDATGAEIYDLQGRRLAKAQKGMNLINGIKVFVK